MMSRISKIIVFAHDIYFLAPDYATDFALLFRIFLASSTSTLVTGVPFKSSCAALKMRSALVDATSLLSPTNH
jgi:hypothetical protein